MERQISRRPESGATTAEINRGSQTDRTGVKNEGEGGFKSPHLRAANFTVPVPPGGTLCPAQIRGERQPEK